MNYMTDQALTWGDVVQVVASAPDKYRPAAFGDICGIWTIDNVENSAARGEPLGTRIYTVEFGDGVSEEIPEHHLERVNSQAVKR